MTTTTSSPVEAGDVHEVVATEHLTRTQIVQYAGASGDFNPLHTDEVYARSVGYDAPVAHGMLTMALAARVVTEWAGAGRLESFGTRFLAPVLAGEAVTVRLQVASVEPAGGTGAAGEDGAGAAAAARVRLDVSARTGSGRAVVSGYAVVLLPAPLV